MWNNSLWEQENQEKLKADYFDRLRAGTSDTYVYPIRRIICGGCGKVFYNGACYAVTQKIKDGGGDLQQVSPPF